MEQNQTPETPTPETPTPAEAIAAEGGGSAEKKSFHGKWVKNYYKEATDIDLSKQALNFSTDEWFAVGQKMELQALLASVCKFGISKSKSNDYSTRSGLMDIFSSAANANAEQTIDIGGLRKLDALFVLMNEGNKSKSLWLDIIKKKRETAIKVSISEEEPAKLEGVSTFLKLTYQLAKSIEADALVVGVDRKVRLVKGDETISIPTFKWREMVKEQEGVDVKKLDVFDVFDMVVPVVSVEELKTVSSLDSEVLHGFDERPLEFWQVLPAIIEKSGGPACFVRQNQGGILSFLDESQLDEMGCMIAPIDFLEVLAKQPSVPMLNTLKSCWLGVDNLEIKKSEEGCVYDAGASKEGEGEATVEDAFHLVADRLHISREEKLCLVKEGKSISVSTFAWREIVQGKGIDITVLDRFNDIVPVISVEELRAVEDLDSDVLHGFDEPSLEFWQVLPAIIEKLDRSPHFVRQGPDRALSFLDESEQAMDCEIAPIDFLEVLEKQPSVSMLNWERDCWLGVNNLNIRKGPAELVPGTGSDGGGGATETATDEGELPASNVPVLFEPVTKMVKAEGFAKAPGWQAWYNKYGSENEDALLAAHIVCAMLTGAVPVVKGDFLGLVKGDKNIPVSTCWWREAVKGQEGVDVKMLEVFNMVVPVVSVEELRAVSSLDSEVLYGFDKRLLEFWQVLPAIIGKLEGVNFVRQEPGGALSFLDESEQAMGCEIGHDDFLEVLAEQPSVAMLDWGTGHWLGVENLKIAKPEGALAYASDADVDGGGGGAAAGESALNVPALVARVNEIVAVEGYVFDETWEAWHLQSKLDNKIALYSAQIVCAMLTGRVPVIQGDLAYLREYESSKVTLLKGIDPTLIDYLTKETFGSGTSLFLFCNIATLEAMFAAIPVEVDLSEERLAAQEKQLVVLKEALASEDSIAQQQEQVTELRAEVAELKSQQQKQVASLEGTVTELKAEMVGLKAEVASQGQAVQQQGEVTELKAEVAELSKQLTQMASMAAAVVTAATTMPAVDDGESPSEVVGCAHQ